MVVEACVSRLPPRVEPRLRVLVAPEELGRPRAATVECIQFDPLRRRAGESHTFLGSEVVIRGLRCFDAVELGHALFSPVRGLDPTPAAVAKQRLSQERHDYRTSKRSEASSITSLNASTAFSTTARSVGPNENVTPQVVAVSFRTTRPRVQAPP